MTAASHALPRRPLAVALAVFVVAAAGLALRPKPPGPALGHRAATAAALRDREVRRQLGSAGWTTTRVSRVDDRLTRVSFFRGDRIRLDAAVDRRGIVRHVVSLVPGDTGYGNRVTHRPAFVLGGLLLFLLCALVVPLRRMRNLDALALASFVLPVWLLDQARLELSVLAAYPALAYLAVRCAAVALRRRPPAPSEPLLSVLLRRTPGKEALRMLRTLTGAAAVALLLVTITSTQVVDVGQASLAGATALLHGHLPYGHIPGFIVHGDTYPLLAYAAYVPAALITPVRDNWDSFDGALWVAAAAALAVGLMLARGAAARPGERERSFLLWVAFPPLAIAASSGTNDLLVAGLVAGAVLVAARRPVAAVALLALATWMKAVPVLALVLFLARLRGRGLAAGLGAVAGISAACGAVLVALGGLGGVAHMLHAMAFQFTRGSLHSLWGWVDLGPLQAVVQAAVLAGLVLAVAAVRRDPRLAADPRRVAALAAALLLGLQLAGNYWAYLYLAWTYPLLGWVLLAPRGAEAPVKAPVARPHVGRRGLALQPAALAADTTGR